MGKNRSTRWRPLGELLFDDGLVTNAELSAALVDQGSLGMPLGEIVVTRGYVSRPTLLRVLATQQNLEVDLERGFGSGLFDAIDRQNRYTRPRVPAATAQTDLLQPSASMSQGADEKNSTKSPQSIDSERGQALVFTVLAMVVLLGMAALAIDVGAWFQTKRHLQATADASALAGAQALPDSPGTATSLALSYAGKNGGGVLGADVSIGSTDMSDDTITVSPKKESPGVFSRVLGIDSVDIGAHATAMAGVPAQALHVAPMVVYCDHPLIHNCNGSHLPTFNVSTTLDYNALGVPGAFGMLNLDGGTGTVGSSSEGQWILTGFDKYLPLGYYKSDPGAKFSSQNIRSALDSRIDTVLLFPVYETLTGTGQNAQYLIIGWIGFMLQGYAVHGNSATLDGYFTTYIASGILAHHGGGGASGGGSTPDFGVRSIQLID